ncbi:DUF3892 domain-containing protein [Hymenobacter crusticola]|uniref:DUF3892 domain-containing protein n=1 Tax=Hymenobacter crusticola TaxID=1770526 RepID=A0A243W824_9BACT|nr:DUF3892 domain-containing protein [Hymenobacter crusticola]OUJ68978.1 hypothetical protein BXP70_27115 [Hymenobacter crusticola]
MPNRITHIRKPNVNSTEEHITHVRVYISTPPVRVTDYTVEEVINWIDKGYQFHVLVGGFQVAVTHQRAASGREYIKTQPDVTRRDNLLSLPQIPN